MARVRIRAPGTNLIPCSQELDQIGSWLLTGLTVSANQSLAPDGTMTADRLTETTSSGFHSCVSENTLTGLGWFGSSSGQTYQFSAHGLQGTRRYMALYLDGNTNVIFDLQAGSVTTTATGSANWTSVSGAIVASTNGFFRCSMSATALTSLASVVPQIMPSTDGTTISYTGDTSKYIDVWGAQWEPGNSVGAYVQSNPRLPIGQQNLVPWSEDWSQSAWTKGTGVTASANSNDVPAPVSPLIPANAQITKVVYDGTGTAAATRISQSIFNTLLNDFYWTGALWVRLLSGGTRNVSILRGLTTATVGVTTTWQRILSTNRGNGNALLCRISGDGSDNAALTLYVTGAQAGKCNGDFPYVKTQGSAINTGQPRRLVSGRAVASNRQAA